VSRQAQRLTAKILVWTTRGAKTNDDSNLRFRPMLGRYSHYVRMLLPNIGEEQLLEPYRPDQRQAKGTFRAAPSLRNKHQ
jgi:hypothetical protein